MSHRIDRRGRLRAWPVDLTGGGAVGGLVGYVLAVNLVIYSGVERGYEARLDDVFRHSAILGLAVPVELVVER